MKKKEGYLSKATVRDAESGFIHNMYKYLLNGGDVRKKDIGGDNIGHIASYYGMYAILTPI